MLALCAGAASWYIVLGEPLRSVLGGGAFAVLDAAVSTGVGSEGRGVLDVKFLNALAGVSPREDRALFKALNVAATAAAHAPARDEVTLMKLRMLSVSAAHDVVAGAKNAAHTMAAFARCIVKIEGGGRAICDRRCT
jgi:hypothetical protein